MRLIPLSSVPNQSFSIQLDGNRWEFTIKQASASMIVNITLNDEIILMGSRLVAGTPVIPYQFLQGSGNFMLLTEDDELPYWERFGVDQQLIYGTFDELLAIPAQDITWPPIPAYQWRQMAINSLLIVLQ